MLGKFMKRFKFDKGGIGYSRVPVEKDAVLYSSVEYPAGITPFMAELRDFITHKLDQKNNNLATVTNASNTKDSETKEPGSNEKERE